MLFLFILGKTWSEWDGRPSGKLSARLAVMRRDKFGFISVKIGLAVFRKRRDSFRVLFLGKILNSRIIHQFCQQIVAKNHCYEVKCNGPAERYPGGLVIPCYRNWS